MKEPLRATLFALRHRGRWGVLLRATTAYGLIAAALFCAAYLAFSTVLGDFLSWPPPEEPPPPDISRILWMFPIILLLGFLYALALASYEAACLRWLIRGEVRGWWGLIVDGDTWRVYGAYWAWFGIYLAWGLAYFVLHALLSRLLGAEHWGVWVGVVLLALAALLSVVSLAPATAATIAKRRFAFLEATEASEGRFWSLLGSYVAIVAGQWLVQQAITASWWTWTVGPGWIEVLRDASDYTSLTQAQAHVTAEAMRAGGAPLGWTVWGVSWLLSLTGMVLLFGVNARVVLLAIDEGRIQPDAK